ncbi:MAG TPA: ATP synthase F1 subunit epsilon [Solirubrobacteraceae bacterium]|nr:ATP synthase F1 subunit epsilon [Solirubrobacteraceae bacterium]
MAHTPFHVEVLTPEGSTFDEDVEMVSTRTEVGSIGILARHQPMLAMLVPSELRLYRSESDIVTLVQGEGYIQVSPDGVLILVEEASEPGDLDVADLREKLNSCENAAGSAEEGSEEARRIARDKRRWETFLRIAEGS